MPTEQVHTQDKELVRRCKQGDDQAFVELVQRYQDRVFNTAFRMMGDRGTAEDVAQEVFLKVYKGLKAFKEQAALSTWIYRITVNQCTSEGRRQQSRKRKQEVSLTPVDSDGAEAPIDPGGDSESPADEALSRERAAMVQAAIQTLEPDFQQALVLRDIEGLSYEEIADIIERPVGTVRSRIHRARLELREKLQKYMEQE